MQNNKINSNIESRVEYSVPSGTKVCHDPIPSLAGEGWIDINVNREKSKVGTLHLSDPDTDQFDEDIKFSVRVGRDSSLEEIDRDDDQHVQNRSEDNKNQHARTYDAGDFYLDWRRDNDIRSEDGDDQIRVRPCEGVSFKHMILTNADTISEYRTDEDGSVTFGPEYAEQSVTIAIIDSTG
jgi:hypothetical protein